MCEYVCVRLRTGGGPAVETGREGRREPKEDIINSRPGRRAGTTVFPAPEPNQVGGPVVDELRK